MLTLIRRPTSMPEPSDSRLQLMPTPDAIVTDVPTSMTDGNHVEDQGVLGHQHQAGRGNRRHSEGTRRFAGVGPLTVERDERLAGGDTVGKRQLLVDDEVLPHRYGEQDAENAGGGQPGE